MCVDTRQVLLFLFAETLFGKCYAEALFKTWTKQSCSSFLFLYETLFESFILVFRKFTSFISLQVM